MGTLSPLLGKGTDADDPLGLQGFDDGSQMGVAEVLHGGGFLGGQFVGRAIAAAVLHEDQRAVVGDEVVFKESVGAAEALFEQTPQSPPTDLRLLAGEADDAQQLALPHCQPFRAAAGGFGGGPIGPDGLVTGRLYFDVVGPPPNSVVYNDGIRDIIAWIPGESRGGTQA